MTDEVKVEVLSIDLINRFFSGLPEEVHRAMVDSMGATLLHMKLEVMLNLFGRVLNRKTGRLSNSVRAELGDSPETISASILAGEGLPYARIHEYGGVIKIPETTYPVKANALRFSDGTYHRSARAHAIPMPERSYMRSVLTQQKDYIEERIRYDFFAAMGRYFDTQFGGRP